MLTEAEITYIRGSVRDTLLKNTTINTTRVDTILGFISNGRFTWAFELLTPEMRWWRIRKNCEIRRQINRLLVPEYMHDLVALRNLVELKYRGYDLHACYEFKESYMDIVAASFRLRRRKLIGGQLLVRYLARINELSDMLNK